MLAVKKLKVGQVSKACHIPTRTFTELLAGRRKITAPQMIVLCEYLDCDPEHLL